RPGPFLVTDCYLESRETTGGASRLAREVATTDRVTADDAVRVLDHGFVRLDDAMADDLSVVNAARVSFARHVAEMTEGDARLIGFLMRERHGCYDDATDVLTAEG